MKRSKKEIAIAVAIVVFVYLSLRAQHARWAPEPVQATLAYTALLAVVGLNVAGWWAASRMSQDANTARWRKRAGLIGLVANTLAIALPFAAFLYGVYVDHLISRGPVNASDVLDLGFVIPVSVALVAFGLVAGAIAPSRLRLAVVVGGLVTFFFLVAIPAPIL
jgi:hypothetical protein